jgi:hypothetical protein
MQTARAQSYAFKGREAEHAGAGAVEANTNQDREINKMKNS